MKKKNVVIMTGAILLLFIYGLGYWSGFSHARRGVRVVVARDTSDIKQSSGKTEYKPYFTKQNAIPDRAR